MSDTLRSRTVRLAFSNAALRPHLLDLLREAASVSEVMATIKIGDIFVSSWGYDQTNVDFYEVVQQTTTMVVIREIEKRVEGSGGSTEKVVPVPHKFIGAPLRRKVKSGWRGDAWIDLNSFSGASKWDGSPVTQTGGGFGH